MAFLRTCRKTKSLWFWSCWRWHAQEISIFKILPHYAPMFRGPIWPAWFANGSSVFCKWHYFDETMFPIVLHQEWPSNSVKYLMTCSMTHEVSSWSNNSNCETLKLKVFEIYHTIMYAYLMWHNSYIGNSTNRTQTEIIDLVAVVSPPNREPQ